MTRTEGEEETIQDTGINLITVNDSNFAKSESKSESHTFFTPPVISCLSVFSLYVLMGCATGYPAILIPSLLDKDKGDGIIANKEEISWIAGLSAAVAIPSCFLVGILSDKIGRKKTFMLSIVPNLIGWFLVATSRSLLPIYLSRIMLGIGMIMVSPVLTYVAEVIDAKTRGSLNGVASTILSCGLLLVYFLGWLLPWRTVSWILFAIQVIPLYIIYKFTPESPPWLITMGRIGEATRNLKLLNGNKGEDEEIRKQIMEMERKCDERSRQQKGKWSKRYWGMIQRRDCYKPLILLTFIFFLQNFMGLVVILYYVIIFFSELGTDLDANAVAVPVAGVRILLSFVSSGLLLRYGRRPILLTCCSIMAILILVSGYFTMLLKQGVELNSPMKLIPTILVFLYISLSVPGPSIIPWSLIPEMYPLEVRGVMSGITLCIAHTLMLTSIKTYFTLSDFLGGSHCLQFFYGLVCIITVIFVYLFIPETHARTPEEIQRYFNLNKIVYPMVKSTDYLNLDDRKDDVLSLSK